MPKCSSLLKLACVAALLVMAGCGPGPSKGAHKRASWPDTKHKLDREARISMARAVEKSQEAQFKEDLAFLEKRNPFAPSFAEVKKTGPALKLEGIIRSDTLPAAIINDNIVSVGDTVGGMMVKEIGQSSVILIKDGKEHKLELRFE